MGIINRYLIILDGRVQGVGMRHFVKQRADKFGISGCVTNKDDGTVEIRAQGDEARLSDFLIAIRAGNWAIRVDDVQVRNLPLTEEDRGFVVIR